jgi:hypothetical protein
MQATTAERRGAAPGRRTRWFAAATVLVVVVTAAACRPLPMGGADHTVGNDPALCPQFQPSNAAGCGPQPLVWAGINGPYQAFAQGDPYSTKCPRNPSNPGSTTNGTPATCDSASAANGAVNPLYDPTGYEYAVDVAPEDVGKPLSLEVYDAGVFQRIVGTSATGSSRVVSGMRSDGTAVVTRASGGGAYSAHDVGDRVTGGLVPAGTTIVEVISSTQVRLSSDVPSSGTGTSSYTVTQVVECNRTLAPFDAPPYTTSVAAPGAQNCQTGDSGNQNFEAQLFQNDGDDETVGYDDPIPACRLLVREGTGSTAIKNSWAPVCTFTPTSAGIHPVRVKSSNIVGVPDSGVGFNGFALRVVGGATSSMYALDTLSIYANTITPSASFYLVEVTTEDAGKRLQLDAFDPGDASGAGTVTVQVLAPPSGAPGRVPTGGTVIPAPGVADSCRYNSSPSPTRGPDVAAPAGAEATQCRVTTTFQQTARYNASWLSTEIDIAEDYACETDCWWTLRYGFGTSTLPTDRVVWAPVIVDRPSAPEPTTTTTLAPVGNPITGD